MLDKCVHHLCFSSVQFSQSVVSHSLRSHESQHARPPCPSPTLGVHSDSRPSSPWCHPAISSSVVSFPSCPQSFPASGSFPMSQLFAWGGQSIGVSASASVLPMNIQDWFRLGLTGLISLQSIYYMRFQYWYLLLEVISALGKHLKILTISWRRKAHLCPAKDWLCYKHQLLEAICFC